MRRTLAWAIAAAFLLSVGSTRADESKDKTDTAKGKTDVEAKKKAKAKKINLYGLNLSYSLQSQNSINTVGEGAQWILGNSFTLTWAFGSVFWPKTKLAKGFYLQARFGVTNELVGNSPNYRTSSYSDPNLTFGDIEYLPISGQGGYLSESNTSNAQYSMSGADRRTDYSDVRLRLANDSWYVIPKAKINIDGCLYAVIPTSLQSRSKGLNTYLTLNAGLSRTFKLPRKLSLSLGYSFSYTRYFWKDMIPQIRDNYDGFTDPVTGLTATDYDYPAGSFNPRDAISNGAWVKMRLPYKFSVLLSYTHMWVAPYRGTDYCIVDLGNGLTTDACQNTYEVRGYGQIEPWQARNFQSFSASVAYKILPYLHASAGLMTQAPERKPNSTTYQQPFLVTNYNRYTMFSLSLTFYTDTFIQKVFGKKSSKPRPGSHKEVAVSPDLPTGM